MKETKTLQKETPRPSKPGIAKLKKPQKISAKNLDDAFDSVAEDLPLIISKESTNFSSISDFSRNGEANTESFMLLDPELSASSGISPHSELTPSSEITSFENDDPGLVSQTECGYHRDSYSKTSSLEAQIAIMGLKKATLALNSDAIDSQSKMLLFALVETAIEILRTVPEERDRFNEILTVKTSIVSGFFLLCIFVTVALRLFLDLESQISYGKAPPT